METIYYPPSQCIFSIVYYHPIKQSLLDFKFQQTKRPKIPFN